MSGAGRDGPRFWWKIGMAILVVLGLSVALWWSANRNGTDLASRSPSVTAGPTTERTPAETKTPDASPTRFNPVPKWRTPPPASRKVVQSNDQAWFGLIDRNGNIRQRVEVQATSFDGRYAAWTEEKGRRGSSLVPLSVPVVYDSQTGETIKGEARRMGRPVGFREGKLLYNKRTDGGSSDGIWQWDPVRDTYEQQIGHLFRADEQASEDLLSVSVETSPATHMLCGGAIYDLRRRHLLVGCGQNSAVPNSPYFIWNDVLVDARSGQALFELSDDGHLIEDVVGEPGGDLLMNVHVVGESNLIERTAIVRCTPAASCELATKIYQGSSAQLRTTLPSSAPY